MKSLKEALVLDGKSDEITGEGCYFHVLTHVSGQSGRCWGLWLPCCGKSEESNGSLSMMAHGGVVTVFLIQPLFCGWFLVRFWHFIVLTHCSVRGVYRGFPRQWYNICLHCCNRSEIGSLTPFLPHLCNSPLGHLLSISC